MLGEPGAGTLFNSEGMLRVPAQQAGPSLTGSREYPASNIAFGSLAG